MEGALTTRRFTLGLFRVITNVSNPFFTKKGKAPDGIRKLWVGMFWGQFGSLHWLHCLIAGKKSKHTCPDSQKQAFCSSDCTLTFLDYGLDQWFLTFVTRMFLNCNSQKPQPAQLVVEASGSCSPKLLSNPRLRTSGLFNQQHPSGPVELGIS